MIEEAFDSIKKLFASQPRTMMDISKRVTSSFGISIGTGLSLESLFKPTHPRYDEQRPIPEKVKLENYNVFAVNLMSIARNIVDSCSQISNDFLEVLKCKEFEDTICEEVNIIEGLMFGMNTKLMVYLPDYDYISNSLNKGKIDTFTKVAAKNLQIYRTLSKMQFSKLGVKLIRGNKLYKLPFRASDKILMYTTYSSDLLNPYNIKLLESHTGVVVDKENFNKRYKKLGDKPFNMLPFDEVLLYLLGDTVTSMLCTHGEKVRKLIYKKATEKNWTPKTSILTIVGELKKEKEIMDAMRNFSRLY